MKFKFPSIPLEEIFGLGKISQKIEVRKMKDIDVLYITKDNNYVINTKGEILFGFKKPLLKINIPEQAIYILTGLMVNKNSGKYFAIVKEYNPFTIKFTNLKKDLAENFDEIEKKMLTTFNPNSVEEKELVYKTEDIDITITPKLLSEIGNVKLFEGLNEKTKSDFLIGLAIGALIAIPITIILTIKLLI